MEYLILICIGIVMGLFGGLLGIGGSIVMIPAMVIFFKQKPEDQHLFQAAAMICNFFVAFSAVIVHRKEKILVAEVVKWLVPAGIIGILAGVGLSNIHFFSGERSTNLTKTFGLFIIYVAVYNILKFGKHDGGRDGLDISRTKCSPLLTLFSGLTTGIVAGFLGMGGGTVSTPMQQLLLKMPLKRAISNSSALITAMALIGAFYKNITLSQHGFTVFDSLKIAGVVIPTAIISSSIGGRLLHILPKDIIRIIFIALLAIASYKLLAP
ncbi:MAG: sulfite exporter TauE/SafE family protein [Planctomycetota bacterium]|jgi:uncharacterized membrane protein YfcA